MNPLNATAAVLTGLAAFALTAEAPSFSTAEKSPHVAPDESTPVEVSPVTPPSPDPLTPILVRPRVEFVAFDAETALLDGVKHFEGYRAKPYVCPGGVKTIGFGATCAKVVARGHLTRAQAEKVLKAELAAAASWVDRIVEVPLNECERAALISFTFNLGPGHLKTLVDKPGRLNDGNRDATIRALPKYRFAGGKVKRGLERRRAWEVELFTTPPVERVALK